MPLSDHEQRLLEQIEQALYAEDPKFATSVASRKMRSHPRRKLVLAVVGAIAGLALVAVGVTLHPSWRWCPAPSRFASYAVPPVATCTFRMGPGPRCSPPARPRSRTIFADAWRIASAVASTSSTLDRSQPRQTAPLDMRKKPPRQSRGGFRVLGPTACRFGQLARPMRLRISCGPVSSARTRRLTAARALLRTERGHQRAAIRARIGYAARSSRTAARPSRSRSDPRPIWVGSPGRAGPKRSRSAARANSATVSIAAEWRDACGS
jgi:hypothetical protein